MKYLNFNALLLLLLWWVVTYTNGQNLVWSDEFDGEKGSQPSTDDWTYASGDGSEEGIPGWGNKESQYYTSNTENVALDGKGHLVITALKRNFSWDLNCYNGPCGYTSAKLVSKRPFRYGRIETRVKLPWGKGLWPAVWLLGANNDCVGWPYSGEIDIMEMKGSKPNSIHGSLHGPGYSGAGAMSATFTLLGGQKFEEQFHVFAIDWEATRIAWSVDDEIYLVRAPDDLGDNPWVFDHPFNIILNLAIGGTLDEEPDNNIFAKEIVIDYVRVYDRAKPFSYSNAVQIGRAHV